MAENVMEQGVKRKKRKPDGKTSEEERSNESQTLFE